MPNAILVLAFAYVRHLAQDRGAAPSGTSLAAWSALTPAGKRIPTGSGKCLLIRYASATCGACIHDAPFFARLSSQMRNLGCEALLVAPIPGLLPTDGWQVTGASMVGFVSPSFAQQLDLSYTPTTILLGSGREILWSRVGVLDPLEFPAIAARLKAR